MLDYLRILNTTTNEAHDSLDMFPAYYLFNFLLYILQVMHVIWFYMILRIAYKALNKGKIEDIRSESGESEHEHKQ